MPPQPNNAPMPDPRSGQPLPQPAPPPGRRPSVVPGAPEPPRRKALGWAVAAVAILGAGGVWFWQQSATKKQGGPGGPSTYATATVALGDLRHTVRLTGSVSAERFAAIMAPPLRGRRGGGGGGGGGSSSSGSSSSSSSSSSSASSSSGGASSSSIPATSNTALAATSSTGIASSLGAVRGSQNRFTDRAATSGSSSGGSSSSSSGPSGSALGSSGLGSTSNTLMSSATRGGGGGGGSEFSLVLSFLATPGSRVRKGDVIAEFDRQYQLLRIDDYKASVLQADLNIRKIKADLAVTTESRTQQLRVAKATLDKARLDLKTLEVVSDIDAQRLKLAAEEAEARYKQLLSEDKLFRESQRAQLRIAEIELAQNQIEMRRAQANVDKMLLKAPMDGIVVLQSIRRGMEMAQVQQGDQVWPGMVFMQIVDPSSMVLNANINQVDSESLRIGMKADVRFDAYPGLAMPAHVYSIGAVPVAGRRANFMKEIKVRLKLEGQDARVIPDLSASADVTLGHVEQAALAPLGAIQWAQGGKPFVLVRSPGGWDRREVEIALRNHLAAAIRSGLRPGEVVALSAAAADKTSEENPPAS